MDNVIANLALQNLGVDIDDEEEKGKWRIENDCQADWALDKIREARADYRRLEMAINVKVAQLKAALDKEKEKTDREVGFFESKLREYFNELPKKALKKTKTQTSYKLPTGKLKLKKSKPDYIRDDTTLIKWLKERDLTDYIETKEVPKWGELKKTVVTAKDKVVTNDGEIIEGIKVVGKPSEFKVEV